MKTRILLTSVAFLIAASTAFAHDLFLRLDTYFLAPNSKAIVRLMNGTFQSSEGAVARDRVRDLTLISPGANGPVTSSISWRAEENTTIMEFPTGEEGTYLIGLSTRPREITLEAAQFNDYLDHDGIPDTLAMRRKNNELGKDVRERYSKHVRAIFQVGNKLSDDYKKVLDYPVEIIPQQNPYSLKAGQTIAVLCLLEGKPIANQFVMAGWESGDGKLHSLNARSDAKGFARIKLSSGKWFIKFIHMTPLSETNLN
jgi:uncharacterized GH25 family protein